MKLTLPQQDVYFEQLLYPDEPIYNIGAKISIKGPLSYEWMNRAYIALIDQHDTYRSTIVRKDDEVHMEVHAGHDTTLAYLDLSGECNAEEQAEELMQRQFREVFSFDNGALLHKFMLIKVAEASHYFFSMYHHIITDGWGTSLMFQRLVRNYNELCSTGQLVQHDLFSYGEFAKDDAVYNNSADFEEDRSYWKNRFQELPERLFNKIEERVFVNESKRKELIVPRSLYDQLEAVALAQKCSVLHVILAVLYMYFGRKHQQQDFAIGLPVLNRGKSSFKKTVGLFMGISPLRMKFSCDDTFETLVLRIKQQLRQDYRHQRFPLGKLIQELDVFTAKDRLFNMTLSYEKQHYADHFLHTTTRVVPLTHGAERVALAIYIREFDAAEDVKIDFDYHVNYFDEQDITDVVAHIDTLLSAICKDVSRPLSAYNYLQPEEEEQLLYGFNQTDGSYPENTTFLSLFNQQVLTYPDAAALSDSKISYTYKELAALSDQMAMRLLSSGGVLPHQPIAVLMPRSARLVAVLLGILKAGHAFIPLDPSFPRARLDYIIDHSGVSCITDIDTDTQTIIPLPAITAADTAYIIYTSGSTGNPKGVEIGHKSLLNFLLSMMACPGFAAGDTLFSVTTQSFDISILEFFGPLISGGHAYIADKALIAEPASLLHEIGKVSPDIMQATPGFYQLLFDAGWEGSAKLKVLCGGDLLSASLAAKLLTGCREVWNMYGPTETTIWSGVKRILVPEDAANIGSPIRNTRFYILDEQQRPLPVNCPGAIYIGGHGLARGYHKHAALTAQKFVDNPFEAGTRMYETGDTGYWNRKGEIIFLGRNDHQVKIRGYRIEPGEIEARLDQLPEIRSSVVVVGKAAACLIAYVIPASGTLDLQAVSDALKAVLPEYMIPRAIIPVNAYPVTPNNKIDRKALAAMALSQPLEDVPAGVPETAMEAKLCHLYKEVLELDMPVGAADNFFSLGGHSINAVKLVNLLQEALACHVSLKELFQYATPRLLADRLQTIGHHAVAPLEVTPEMFSYPVAPVQYPIWLAAQQGPELSAAYNLSVVYKVTGELRLLQLQEAFHQLIAANEILRTNFIEQQGIPRQQVRAVSNIHFEIEQVKEVPAFINRPFDLEHDLLLRVGVYVTADASYLAFSSHHIILDGWSLGLMITAVSSLYNVIYNRTALPAFQYKDYVAWLQKADFERNERFWGHYLQGYQWKNVIPQLNGKMAAGGRAAHHHCIWDNEFYTALKETGLRQRSSLHTLLLSGFLVLLHKQYGQADICIGTVNAGRTVGSLHRQIGMFVKTLPLRARISADQTVTDLMSRVHADLLEMDHYQDLQAYLHAPDILLVLQPPAFNYDEISMGEGVRLTMAPVTPAYCRFPLQLNFIEMKNGLRCELSYDTTKYHSGAIELLFSRYEKLLKELILNANASIADLDITLSVEREPIDIDFDF